MLQSRSEVGAHDRLRLLLQGVGHSIEHGLPPFDGSLAALARAH
jgi:hypothetical protein